MPAFFDTNIVVYAFGSDTAKAEAALDLLGEGGWVSVQVLNELTLASRRKLRHEWERTNNIVAELSLFVDVCDMTRRIHDRGRDFAERFRFHVYDAMIVSAAIETGCDTLYSEDMQDGQIVDGIVRIVNPFRLH